MTLQSTAITAVANAFSTTSTGTFSPPANSRVFIYVMSDAGTGGTETNTVTGGGLTWSLAKRANGAPGAACEVWHAPCSAGATNITASVTNSAGAVDKRVTGEIFTDTTGGMPAGVGATSSTNSSQSTAYTSTVANSWARSVGLGGGGAPVVGTGQTLVDSDTSFDGGDGTWVIKQNATTPTVGTTVTNNVTAPSFIAQQAMVEVLPASTSSPVSVADGSMPGVRVGTSPATVAVGITFGDTSEPGVRVGVSAATVSVGTGASDNSMPGIRVGTSPATVTFDIVVTDSSSQGIREGTSPASAAIDQFAGDTSEPGVRVGTSGASVAVGVATSDTPSPGIRIGQSAASTAIDVVSSDVGQSGVRVGISGGSVTSATGASDTVLGGIRVGTSPAGTTIDMLTADIGQPGIRVGVSGAIVGTAVSATDSSSPGLRVGTSPSGLTFDVVVSDTPSGIKVGQSAAQAVYDMVTADAPTGIRAGTSPATVTVNVAISDSGGGVRVGSSPASVAFDLLIFDGSSPAVIVGVSPATVDASAPPSEVTIQDTPSGIRVGVSGARILISSSPYPPIYLPELDLLALQRDATHLMIEADPTTVVLVPRDMTTKSRTGGQYREDMPPRDPQVFKLIAMTFQEKPIVTPDGQERIINYTLLGDWDAVVEIGDHWVDGQYRYEVVAIEDGHDYETKALVERHG